MKIITVSFVLGVAMSSPVIALGQSPDFRTADSLLVLGRLEQVDSILKSTEVEFTSNPPDSLQLKELGKYRVLFNDLVQYVAQAGQAQPAALSLIAEDGRKSAHLYTESRAGRSAAAAYSKFEALSKSGPSVEATKFLRIARMLKIIYTDRTLSNTRRLMADASRSFDQNDLNRAAKELYSITWDPEHRLTEPGLADSLNALSGKVNRALARIEQRKYLWQQHEVVQSSYAFSLITHLAVQTPGTPMPLSIHNDTSTLRVTLSEQETRFPFAIGIQVWRSLSEKFQAGVTLYTVKYSFTTKLDPRSFSTAFDVRHWYASVSGRYLFRSSIGLRPYVDLGVGLRGYSQKEAQCVVLTPSADTSEADIPNRYVLDARSGSTAIGTTSLGLQFVPTPTSKFGVSSEVSLFYNMKKDNLVERLYLTLGLHFDLLL